jgi:hypothetical protein
MTGPSTGEVFMLYVFTDLKVCVEDKNGHFEHLAQL